VARILPMLTDNDRKIYNMVKDRPMTKKELADRSKFPPNLIDKITNELSKYALVKKIKRP
jgi:DNA-binding IscR family transcriptional regulator